LSVPKICVVRVGGTNCDEETKIALQELGARAEVIHMKKILKDGLEKFDALVIPGGFSYGDHIRAGAILGRVLFSSISEKLVKFLDEKKPILGICNGFQVLVESGLLPGFDLGSQQAALALNVSAKYECRWVHLKHENRGKCVFTRKIKKGRILLIPVAHAEGRFVFEKGGRKEYLRRLLKGDQLVFRYCDEEGRNAGGKYPINPNGSFYDIAGICDPSGLVLGMMPHPERAFYGFQLPNWTARKPVPKYGDGMAIFKSLVDYLRG